MATTEQFNKMGYVDAKQACDILAIGNYSPKKLKCLREIYGLADVIVRGKKIGYSKKEILKVLKKMNKGEITLYEYVANPKNEQSFRINQPSINRVNNASGKYVGARHPCRGFF